MSLHTPRQGTKGDNARSSADMQMFGDGNGVKRGRGVHMDVKRI